MKQINTYINEKLRLTNKHTYTCKPKNKDELQEIILKRIENEGQQCDLNDIDTSKIDDMSNLFDARDYEIFENFNGDVSMWNVSNVENMFGMFYLCKEFNCDLSMWNVSNVISMRNMFDGCHEFDCDISKWDVSNVENMYAMFFDCKNFNCNLSSWNISKVENIGWMFCKCNKFNQDLDSWDVSKVEDMFNAFRLCPTKPTWYDRKQWDEE